VFRTCIYRNVSRYFGFFLLNTKAIQVFHWFLLLQELGKMSSNKLLVPMFLLQQFYFYGTGHETTFTNIRWETVFHGLDGRSDSIVFHAIYGFLLVLGTFGSYIVVLFCVYHLIEINANKNPDKEHQKKTRDATHLCSLKLIILVSIKVSSTSDLTFMA
jgi:hypothetical protein